MFATSPAFLAIAALLMVTPTSSLPVGNDVDQKLERRIVNGEKATANSFPFIVSLQVGTSHFCGGTLIAPQWVLTAAHCFHTEDNNPINPEKYILFKVVLGEHDLDEDSSHEQIRKVSDIIFHQGYNQSDGTFHDDIALIKLDSPVTLNKYVAIAPISRDPNVNLKTADCVLIGWGKENTKFDPSGARVLMQARMELIPHDKCWKDWADEDKTPLSRSQVCVRDTTTTDFDENKSACSGDSGGPMMCGGNHDVITGVASIVMMYGKERYCRTHKVPNVYTKVAAYAGWIEGHTGDLRQYNP